MTDPFDKPIAEMNEDELQSALHAVNARREEAQAEALEITAVLDTIRTRDRARAKIKAAGLSEAEVVALTTPVSAHSTAP